MKELLRRRARSAREWKYMSLAACILSAAILAFFANSIFAVANPLIVILGVICIGNYVNFMAARAEGRAYKTMLQIVNDREGLKGSKGD